MLCGSYVEKLPECKYSQKIAGGENKMLCGSFVDKLPGEQTFTLTIQTGKTNCYVGLLWINYLVSKYSQSKYLRGKQNALRVFCGLIV